MATLTYSRLLSLQNLVYVVSSVRTNFLYSTYDSTYDLALHQSACYLLAKRVKKEQKSTVHCQKAAIRELQHLAQLEH